jgi:hypothetical protein
MESMMAVKGLYRTKTEESGAEYVFVDHGKGPSMQDTMPRKHYEDQGYLPPFDALPTKQEYEGR